MDAASIPYKFAEPWGAAAGGSFITSPIPDIVSSGTLASQHLGFPPATATPTGAGGVPPGIADFNGVLSYLSLWAQWLQAGSPTTYDATFSGNIGGYPKGATLANASTPGLFWTSTVDNNTSNPDTGGANWTSVQSQANTWSGVQTHSSSIVLNNNVPLAAKDAAGAPHNLIYHGTDDYIHIIGGANGLVVHNQALTHNNFQVYDNGDAGIYGNVFLRNDFALYGNDAGGTPRAMIQYTSGNAVLMAGGQNGFYINNFANTVNNFVLSDAGNGTFVGTVSAAAATASGNAVILGQFPSSLNGIGWKKYPDPNSPTGYFIEQWGVLTAPDNATTTGTYPISFPNGVLNFVCSLSASISTNTYAIGGQSISNSQFEITNTNPGASSLGTQWTAKGY